LKVSYRNIAATACSKPVSDLDGTSEHIGAKTGKPVATNLYIAIGGAIQHKWEQLFKVKVVINSGSRSTVLKAGLYIVGDAL
jgi:electron transfer flavoprotein alpha subunit